ncbi:hypothetical protein [Streptomyces sp. NPDC093094]|uniref:hypothetical protein n=1 Tax=Streptomyces sp. NPDC093094 TaxID=3366026 RepID=UPI003804E203
MIDNGTGLLVIGDPGPGPERLEPASGDRGARCRELPGIPKGAAPPRRREDFARVGAALRVRAGR